MGRGGGVPRGDTGYPPRSSFFAASAFFRPPSAFFSRPFSFGAGTAFDFGGDSCSGGGGGGGVVFARGRRRGRSGVVGLGVRIRLEPLPLRGGGGGGGCPCFFRGGFTFGGGRLGVVVVLAPSLSSFTSLPSPPSIPRQSAASSHSNHPTSTNCPRSGLVGPRGAPQLQAPAAVLPLLQAAEHGQPQRGVLGEELVEPPQPHAPLPVLVAPNDMDGAHIVSADSHVLDLQQSMRWP